MAREAAPPPQGCSPHSVNAPEDTVVFFLIFCGLSIFALFIIRLVLKCKKLLLPRAALPTLSMHQRIQFCFSLFFLSFFGLSNFALFITEITIF